MSRSNQGHFKGEMLLRRWFAFESNAFLFHNCPSFYSFHKEDRLSCITSWGVQILQGPQVELHRWKSSLHWSMDSWFVGMRGGGGEHAGEVQGLVLVVTDNVIGITPGCLGK